jgi:hypothetical protein
MSSLAARTISKAFVAKIRREYAALQRDEGVLHNKDLHHRILANWEQESPRMLARLRRRRLDEALAFVVQERMWRERDELVKAGMSAPDAREQAERNHLMLEPESPPADVDSPLVPR